MKIQHEHKTSERTLYSKSQFHFLLSFYFYLTSRISPTFTFSLIAQYQPTDLYLYLISIFQRKDFLWICISLVYCGELLLSLYLYISIASLSIDQSPCLSSLLIPPKSHLLIFHQLNNKLLSIYLHQDLVRSIHYNRSLCDTYLHINSPPVRFTTSSHSGLIPFLNMLNASIERPSTSTKIAIETIERMVDKSATYMRLRQEIKIACKSAQKIV